MSNGTCEPKARPRCLWQNEDYSARVLDFRYADSNHGNDIYFVTGANVNGSASSAANYHFGCQVRLFNGTNYVTLFKTPE